MTLDHVFFLALLELRATMALSLPMNWASISRLLVLSLKKAGDSSWVERRHSLSMRSTVPLCQSKKLYSAMEDFYIDMIGTGESQVSSFTLIGATTPCMLSITARSLWTRTARYYEQDDLTGCQRTAEIFEIGYPRSCRRAFSSRSRGTPQPLSKQVRDFAQMHGRLTILFWTGLSMLDVDHEGLDYVDQKICVPWLALRQWPGRRLGSIVMCATKKKTVELYGILDSKGFGPGQGVWRLWTPGLSL